MFKNTSLKERVEDPFFNVAFILSFLHPRPNSLRHGLNLRLTCIQQTFAKFLYVMHSAKYISGLDCVIKAPKVGQHNTKEQGT